jgi:arylsulfatase A-like enzyme/Flp pilus assembly protein TadD
MCNRTSLWSAVCLALLAACGGSPTSPTTTSDESQGAPSLLLITLDTTRVDRLGCYGHAAAQTPNLDSLARDGARFTRAYAHVPLTLPSHASLMTGTFPPEHGIHDNGRDALGPELTTLAELFRTRGFRTGAFIAAVALDGSFGLDRGFDVYDDFLGQQGPDQPRLIQRRGDLVVDDALAWLKSSEEPFFAWVHLYDPHARYEPPADFSMADPYDGEIAFMDAQIGRLLGWLDSSQLSEQTLVVAIADHGESLGEHGESTHASFIYQGTQHIPLLVRAPGVVTGGLVCEDLVQQADLLPTLLELYGWPRLGQVSGRSFAPALRGEALAEEPAYLESLYCAQNFGWSPLRGLVQGKWKLIQAPSPELYDLEKDPREQNNLASERTDLVEALSRRLQELRDRMKASETASAPSNPALTEALSGLGYAQGSPSRPVAEDGSGRNPVEFIDVLELYHAAVGHGHVGEQTRMIEPLEEVVRRCPDSAGFRALLGESYLSNGRLEEARVELELAVELDPTYDPALYYLGRLYARMGELEKSIAAYEATLALQPTNVPTKRELAVVLQQVGQTERARGLLEEALESDPGSPVVWGQLASLRVESGSWSSAVEALERARALAPEDPGLLNFHAWILATAPEDSVRSGARAVELGERLVAKRARDAGFLDTLAACYAEAGRFPEAISSAERALELAPALDEAELEAMRARLALYREGRPYRDGP